MSEHGLILLEVFWYMERIKNLEKDLHNHAKIHLPEKI